MKRIFALAMMTATGLIAASPVMADNTNGYGVGTSAVTGVFDPRYGGIASSTAAYRMGQDSSFAYSRMTDTPPVSFNNCAARAQFGDTCAATQDGTSVPGYNETASNSSATIAFAFQNEVTPRNGTASSYANLTTGKLGAVATGEYFVGGYAISAFQDTLTFNIDGASASTVTNIAVSFLLDGTIIYGPAGAGIQNSFSFGNGRGSIAYSGSDSAKYATQTAAGWVSYDFGTPTDGLTRFTGVYALTGASETIGITDFLRAELSHSASVLYGNTSAVSFELPTNVTFTSASGVFLTANQVAAVPEPATWGMMLLGFGLVGSAMRRRDATRVHALA